MRNRDSVHCPEVFYQGGAFERISLLGFRFQIYCSCFNYIYDIRYPSLNKLRKTFIKVVKTSRFNLLWKDQKNLPKNVCELDQELEGGELSFLVCVPGVGNRPPRKKKIGNPRGVPVGNRWVNFFRIVWRVIGLFLILFPQFHELTDLVIDPVQARIW